MASYDSRGRATEPNNVVRVAAIGDLHCHGSSTGALQPVFSLAAERADVLLLCGDLTEHGLASEARVLARELMPASQISVIAILGNHDYESGEEREVTKILGDAGIVVLDGEGYEARGIGFAGAKGFAGGFGAHTLQAWGERTVKDFVHVAVEEALKIESALAKLRTSRQVALLHYAPVRATVVGEPEEIFPFLGSSRLEEPLNRFSVAAAFHGHAHAGRPEGRTSTGVPVYNVARPLLERTFPGQPPIRVVEIPVAAGERLAQPVDAQPDRSYSVRDDVD